MRVLLAEYACHHDPALASEGEAMFRTLRDSFTRTGYEVVMPAPGADFADELRRLAPSCEEALVIAPDHLLARYTKIVEDLSRNIGCNSLAIAVCANKRRTADTLKAHGIDVPAEVTTGKRVIKEISGCGAIHMRYRDEEPEAGEFGQEFIEGEHLSVSMVGSRVVGEVCLYYTGEGPMVLSLNRQNISIDKDGNFHYDGGETPASHSRAEEIISTARKAATILGCQGYIGVDLVVSSDRIVIVDVNPRPTDSIVGIAAIMEEEIADIIVKASYGRSLEKVTLKGKAQFGKDGSVTVSDRD
ncbi:MAG TPA: ATP-grasp domain-containing protein [Methanospirillum sp.]|uniref:ATP-grasp domain-containing protein n=1 Tax=Methanospirillum sp. TaxID=45200 RepID=UPI002B582D16|nr:ATP-grasp domain-containing protein [Methanospirillum sp.]HWQ65091.1 ATP-grasp domain-containing protein [Methanospirillum sp.]